MSSTPRVTRREHEFEPQYGLPEQLPAGERLLWQGMPAWRRVARHAFHWNKLAFYFGLLLAWRIASQTSDGAGFTQALAAAVPAAALFAVGLALVAGMAWLTAHTTAYTVTTQRVVMRVGIVLTVSYNLPLRRIDAAHLRPLGAGCGDIALALKPDVRIAWLHLWPHVRPWQLMRTQPMLRCLPGAERVARLLGDAWAAANAQSVAPPVAQSTAPAGAPAIATSVVPHAVPAAMSPRGVAVPPEAGRITPALAGR
jgi:hypothetical protein